MIVRVSGEVGGFAEVGVGEVKVGEVNLFDVGAGSTVSTRRAGRVGAVVDVGSGVEVGVEYQFPAVLAKVGIDPIIF